MINKASHFAIWHDNKNPVCTGHIEKAQSLGLVMGVKVDCVPIPDYLDHGCVLCWAQLKRTEKRR